MDSNTLITGLAGILVAAAPLIFAVIGETISERAGVINLSMNGTILLTAMGGFAVAVQTQSILMGFLAGAAIGAAVALIVAVSARKSVTDILAWSSCPCDSVIPLWVARI